MSYRPNSTEPTTERALLLAALDRAKDLEQMIHRQGEQFEAMRARLREQELQLRRAHQATEPTNESSDQMRCTPKTMTNKPAGPAGPEMSEPQPEYSGHVACPNCGAPVRR